MSEANDTSQDAVAAIKSVAADYNEAVRSNDSDMFRRAFHVAASRRGASRTIGRGVEKRQPSGVAERSADSTTASRFRLGWIPDSLRNLRDPRIPVVPERDDQRLRQHDRRRQGPEAVHLGVAHHEVAARVAG